MWFTDIVVEVGNVVVRLITMNVLPDKTTCVTIKLTTPIGIAYASLKLYDEPIREWLKQRLFPKEVA